MKLADRAQYTEFSEEASRKTDEVSTNVLCNLGAGNEGTVTSPCEIKEAFQDVDRHCNLKLVNLSFCLLALRLTGGGDLPVQIRGSQ